MHVLHNSLVYDLHGVYSLHMEFLALVAVLGLGLGGYAVIGMGTTDPGPRGDKRVRVGLTMVGVSISLAVAGAMVAAWRR